MARHQGYTGTGDILSVNQMLWRLFFMTELAIVAIVVFGAWKYIFNGEFTELWPGALFCYSVVLAIIADIIVKTAILHRRPLLSPVSAVIVSLLFLAAGIGLSWVMTK
jgi:hypothetical protein